MRIARYPQKGDARVAFDAIDERAHATVAASDDHRHDAGDGTYDATTGQFTGEAARNFNLAYGDLFIVEDVLAEGGLSLVASTARTWLETCDSGSALASLLLQAMAVGVVMERQRWERGDA